MKILINTYFSFLIYPHLLENNVNFKLEFYVYLFLIEKISVSKQFLNVQIDEKYGNLNRKIYIDLNLEHLSAYKISHDISDFYFRRIFSKISEKSVVS